MAFRWRADDTPLVVLDPFSPHEKKNVVIVGPPLTTKLSGSAHAYDCNQKCISLTLCMLKNCVFSSSADIFSKLKFSTKKTFMNTIRV